MDYQDLLNDMIACEYRNDLNVWANQWEPSTELCELVKASQEERMGATVNCAICGVKVYTILTAYKVHNGEELYVCHTCSDAKLYVQCEVIGEAYRLIAISETNWMPV